MYGVRKCSSFILLQMVDQFSQHHLSLEIVFSPLYILAFFIKDKVSIAAKSLQLCPALCDPIDGSPPGSPVPGILQARTLEWAAISFSNA